MAKEIELNEAYYKLSDPSKREIVALRRKDHSAFITTFWGISALIICIAAGTVLASNILPKPLPTPASVLQTVTTAECIPAETPTPATSGTAKNTSALPSDYYKRYYGKEFELVAKDIQTSLSPSGSITFTARSPNGGDIFTRRKITTTNGTENVLEKVQDKVAEITRKAGDIFNFCAATLKKIDLRVPGQLPPIAEPAR